LIGLSHIRTPSEVSQWHRFAQKLANGRKRSKQATHRLTSHIRRSDFADREDGMAWANKGCKSGPG
jgi:ferredoxin